jgi:hypothetical protein
MKTKIILLGMLTFIGLSSLHAQVGIGTTSPDASSVVDVESTTQGFLPPRLNTAQRDAIASPAEGLMIFNTTNGCLEFFNATYWVSTCDGSLQAGRISDCDNFGFIPPFVTASETEIVDVNVTTSSGSQIWMDRNLGAVVKARAIDDCWAYGNLHQWGRDNDGHEFRGSNVEFGPKAAGTEGSDFLRVNSGNFDWLSTQDGTRWGDPLDDDKGIHDPCPDGYRIPTEAELQALMTAFSPNDASGAFSSRLALTVGGERVEVTGVIGNNGVRGIYWSSTEFFQSFERGRVLRIDISTNNKIGEARRAKGVSVRCIKD